MKLEGWLYAPWSIPEQGLHFDYKYLLIRESRKEARASFGRIKADLVAVLFLWDGNNLALEFLCKYCVMSQRTLVNADLFDVLFIFKLFFTIVCNSIKRVRILIQEFQGFM